MTRFVIVPQWQGSASARAMQLIDGAQAIAGDLPRSTCTTVEVPLEAGEAAGTGVHRFSALHRTRGLVDEALAGLTEPVMVVGGDCGVAVGSIAHAAARHPGLAVVWLDAHPDLHSPATSASGAFGGMALRAVIGDGAEGLALAPGVVEPSRVVLAGARDFDEAEEPIAAGGGIRVIDANALAAPESLADAVAATGADAVYVHVDLDVLDPSAFTGVTSAVPFGIQVSELVAALGALRKRVPLVGSSIAGFAPSSPAAAIDDLGAILRIVGALA
ncbi:MAG: arginase family protein [Microbacterium sp.]